jgi:NitT/TauT family transport system substrate-binding protein
MKKSILTALLLLCMLIFTACKEETKNTENVPNKEQSGTQETTAGPNETNDREDSEPGDQDQANQGTQNPAQKQEIRIAALKGPTAIGMVKIMEDTSKETAANDYQFTIAGTADEISVGLMKGDFDIAAIPCNLASVLYQKTEGAIKLAGINTLGVLYIVETGDTIHSVEDLKGKTIYSTGLGTTPQYTLNYLLKAYGLDPDKDVTIEYKTEATEVAAILSEGKEAIALLPQPYVTTVMLNNEKLRIALDVAEEWNKVSTDGSSVVTGVVVVRTEFLESNPEAFEAFMTEYAVSAAYVNENIEEAASLVEKYDIFKAGPMKKAIPYCNITLLQGEEMKQKVSGYLNALYEQEPKAVGGKLPSEDFYYLP